MDLKKRNKINSDLIIYMKTTSTELMLFFPPFLSLRDKLTFEIKKKKREKYQDIKCSKEMNCKSIIEFVSLGYAGQSDELKAKLIDSLDSKFRLEKNVFDVPILSNGKELFHVSLSHHGRYGAYVRA